jgi:hypothetical protein
LIAYSSQNLAIAVVLRSGTIAIITESVISQYFLRENKERNSERFSRTSVRALFFTFP